MAIFGSGLGKNKLVKGGVHPGISMIVLIASFVRAFTERLPGASCHRTREHTHRRSRAGQEAGDVGGQSSQVPNGSRLSCGLRLPQTSLTWPTHCYSRRHERPLRSSGRPRGKRPDQPEVDSVETPTGGAAWNLYGESQGLRGEIELSPPFR